MILEDLFNFLECFLYECELVRVFLREMLVGVVLEMIFQFFLKFEFINFWIVYFLEVGELDFNQVIDVGMQIGFDVVFVDIDGNVGNIGFIKGNRNFFDYEWVRCKEFLVYKKKFSKVEEEMELVMEEMK